MIYDNDFCSLGSVTRQLEITNTGADNYASDIALITDLIHEISSVVKGITNRTFVPYVDTRSLGAEFAYDRELWLDEDLLSITSVTDALGSTVSASNYRMYPLNVYPKSEVWLLNGTDWNWSDEDDTASITGTWGYHENSAQMWKSNTTLSAEIADTTTSSVTVTSAANLDVLDYIKVDDEFMQITAISTNTLTVDRGVNGTTAATHDDASTVYQYQPVQALSGAVKNLVVWAYQKRSQLGTTIQMGDGVAIIEEAPRLWTKAIYKLKRYPHQEFLYR